MFPVDEFFVREWASPATFTAAGGIAKEIQVLFDRESVDQAMYVPFRQLGGVEFVNPTPRATARKRDVPGAKAGDALAIHGYLTPDDRGSCFIDGQGNTLIVPNVEVYVIHSAHPDETGLTELILSIDT